MTAKLIAGNTFTADRGTLVFLNDFNINPVKDFIQLHTQIPVP